MIYLNNLVNCSQLLVGLVNVKNFDFQFSGPAGSQELNPFSDLESITKLLKNHPKTKGFFSDSSYVEMLEELHKNPKSLAK